MNIEQLKKEVSSIETSLNELKKNIWELSEDDKNKQSEEFKTKVEEVKKKINNRIAELSEKTDDNSRKELEEVKQLLDSLDKIVELQHDIIEGKKISTINYATQSVSWHTEWEVQNNTWGVQWEREEWFFWKIRDWTKDQWNDVWNKEKRKAEWGKNVLRTAWFTATWVWAVALACKWIKKIWDWVFWDDESDEDDIEENETKLKKKKKKKESSWWKKFLVGAWLAAWTAVGWVEIYKHWNRISSRFKEKLWLALSFDEAIQKVEAEVCNWKIDDDHFWVFNAHFDWWIKYEENTSEICSYWQKTKINKNGKKLEWLDVEFASWEEMIHAANIVNFAKRMLRWRGASEKPFIYTSRWWDIAFNCSAKWKQEFLSASNSNEWTWILGTLWTLGWGILWWYCAWVKWAAVWAVWWWTWWYVLWAYIDNKSTAWSCCETISRWKNLDEFMNYLNRQQDENWKSLWVQWEEKYEPDNTTPMHKFLNEVKKEIDESYGNGDEDSTRRNLRIEQSEWNPKEYIISSYNHKLKITLEWWPAKWEKIDFTKIKKIHIEKYDEYDSRWDWLDIDFPHTEDWLKEAIKTANLTNKIVEDRKRKWWESYPFAYGRYKTPFNLDIDIDWFMWTAIVGHSMLKNRFPSIFEDLGKYPYIKGAISDIQEEMHDQALKDKSEWSQYIKFLHQIGKWRFWKKM